MATHDYEIANGTGAAVRSDLNNALAAIRSNNSSASAPASTFAYMWWADTTDNVLKMRNSANNAWITLQQLDGTLLMEDGTEGAPGLALRDDTDTGLFSPGANVLAVSSGGNERIRFGNAEVVVNDGSDDVDFRVESDSTAHMLFVNGGTNRVGIATSSPSALLHVAGTCRVGIDDTSNALLEIGAGATGSRNAILDFVGDTTYTDYGLRVIRGNGGANTNSTIEHRGTGAFLIKAREAGAITFTTDNTERFRVTSDGKMLLGFTSRRANFFNSSDSPRLQLESTTFVDSAISCVRNANSSAAGGLILGKSRGTANNSNTVVQNGDSLGQISFQGADGSQMVEAAKIAANIDQAPGADDMPGRLVFMTTNDGSSSATEKMRVTHVGNVAIGTTSASAKFDVSGDAIFGNKSSGNSEGGQITLRAKNGSTSLAHLDVDASDDVRLFSTVNNTNFRIGQLSGTGGNLFFFTEGSERFRVSNAGNILIHQTAQNQPGAGNTQLGASFTHDSTNGTSLFVSRSNNVAAHFNRAQDGAIVSFASAGNTEGSLNISGSDFSLAGATLSRWSQLAGNAERTEILRGSVLSNLDEMCEWAHAAQDEVLWTAEDELPEGVSVGDVKTPARDAYTELNEQLNRMKVSDVEGDTNVAGVFQAWDDDDDTFTNDFYCMMTGDFVIRIAQGTTVARGDLLMSAGDGTAKPQDDDIVRSKTIAKVTSTTVSTTYADGSYCVPCVLMAC